MTTLFGQIRTALPTAEFIILGGGDHLVSI
jgi:hypothetical protein